MDDPSTLRIGGALVAASVLLLIAGMLIHPPPDPDIPRRMDAVATQSARWALSHWLVAVASAASATGALLILTSGRGLAPLARASWAVLVVFQLLFAVTPLAEATVAAHAARVGDRASFEAWSVFADGVGPATAPFVVLALMGLALAEARAAAPLVPRWTARAVLGLGPVMIVAMIGLFVLQIEALAPAFLGQILLMLWFGWLGLRMGRAATSTDRAGTSPNPSTSS